MAARNEARDVKLGLIPLDEMTQVFYIFCSLSLSQSTINPEYDQPRDPKIVAVPDK